MQTFEEYEKTVPSYVPKGDIHWLMGRVHVGTPDAEIEQEIRRRLEAMIRAGKANEGMVAECVKYAIACHRENQGLYNAVVTGRF